MATASHELRTPLTSLDGMLELLDDDLHSEHPDLEDARALLDRARAQSRRLGRLAADLLDLSRLDAKVDLRSEPVELGELSRAVMAEFELGTAERAISIRLEDHGSAVWALGDPGSIARILRILLDNALRISPAQFRAADRLDGRPRRPNQRPRPGARRAPEDDATRSSGAFTAAATPAVKPGSGSGWPSVASWPSGWVASSSSMTRRRRGRASRYVCRAPHCRPGRCCRPEPDSITIMDQRSDAGDDGGR